MPRRKRHFVKCKNGHLLRHTGKITPYRHRGSGRPSRDEVYGQRRCVICVRKYQRELMRRRSASRRESGMPGQVVDSKGKKPLASVFTTRYPAQASPLHRSIVNVKDENEMSNNSKSRLINIRVPHHIISEINKFVKNGELSDIVRTCLLKYSNDVTFRRLVNQAVAKQHP